MKISIDSDLLIFLVQTVREEFCVGPAGMAMIEEDEEMFYRAERVLHEVLLKKSPENGQNPSD